MYLYPRMDVTGKRPVWLGEILPHVSTILAWERWDQAPGVSSYYGAVVIYGWLLFFVEKRLFYYWQRCTLAVWMLFGRCL